MPFASFYSLDLISTFFFCVQIFVRIKSTLNDQGSRISLSHAVFIATKISGKACRLSSRGGGGVQSVVFFGTASPIGSFFEARVATNIWVSSIDANFRVMNNHISRKRNISFLFLHFQDFALYIRISHFPYFFSDIFTQCANIFIYGVS